MSAANNLRTPWDARKALTRGTDGKEHPDDHALDVFDSSGTKIHHGAWGGKERARLIAAAPELLAACEAVDAASMDELPRAVVLVHAAIIKAKGGAQ